MAGSELLKIRPLDAVFPQNVLRDKGLFPAVYCYYKFFIFLVAIFFVLCYNIFRQQTDVRGKETVIYGCTWVADTCFQQESFSKRTCSGKLH